MMAAMESGSVSAGPIRMAGALTLGEGTLREAGAGPILTLAELQGHTLLLTMEITRVTDRQSLGLSVWGSVDGVNWGSDPLLSLPRKYYCGTYETPLDLRARPDIKYLVAKWTVSRWADDGRKPLFAVRLSVEQKLRVLSAGHIQ